MSIYNSPSQSSSNVNTSFIGTPPICKFRRALEKDIEEASELVTPATTALFGNQSLAYKVRRCFFSMVGVNAEHRIVCIICLDDHPNIPALPNSEWECWIKYLYNLNSVTSQNTLWIHLMACDVNYNYLFVKPLLESIFKTFPLLVHLLAVAPGDTPCFDYMEENFTCIMPVGYRNPRKVQTLYLTLRHHYTKKYKIRLAVEEDNDDLIPLIDSHSTRLKEMYGDFYVSEILTKHPEMNRQLIVAEIAERAVAVLFLNNDVNYNSLIKSFALEPFCDLYKIEDTSHLKRHEMADFSNIVLAESLTTSYIAFAADNQEKENFEMLTPVESYPVEEKESSDEFVDENIDFEGMGLQPEDLLRSMSDLLIPQISMDVLKAPSSFVIADKTRKKRTVSLPNTEFLSTYKSRDKSSSKLKLSDKSQPSAFTLEIMAAGEEHEESVLCDLLEASFQNFPVKNFCVFSVLPIQPHFPLFDYFVKAVPRRCSTYPQELYILHKNAIKANLHVRKMQKRDFKTIEKIVSTLDKKTALIEDVIKSLNDENCTMSSYVLINGTAIVGLAVLQVEKDIDHLLAYYNVHRYINYNVHRYDKFGVIQHCAFSIIFQKHSQFFLRELHRLSDMSILFYKLPRIEISQTLRTKPLPCLLKELIPVLDRQLPTYHTLNMHDVEVPQYFSGEKKDMFALYISTPRLCSLPRVDINSRLVVVGASNLGLSFLENLVFYYDEKRHVIFNNLTLVFDRSVRDSINVSKHTPSMFTYHGNFSANHLNSVCFHSHVNYINGTMTEIDRKNKYITINFETILPYDYLFLMCGQQYHQPYSPGIRKDGKIERCPYNVFIVNKYKDAEESINKLLKIIHGKTNYTVIVYGATFNAYSCIATLQRMKMPNSCIKFVETYPDEFERPSIDVFNNPELYESFQDMFDMTGIDAYRGYYFVEWEENPIKNMISWVKFQSRKANITLQCDAMFFYSNKEVHFNTFTAVNNAGLVYDGKLVIGPDCRTNDPCIFSAGPMTKYKRIFYADRYLHKYYNSYEIGQRLAIQIRAMLLPGGLEENKGDPIFDILNNENTNKLVPQYTKPLIVSCILPGNYNYLDIHSPGKPSPVEREMVSRTFGYVLCTGNLARLNSNDDPKYFRIHVDSNDVVKHITCVTKQDIDIINLSRIWGQHEKILNNLLTRYKMRQISNFFDYFQDPCFCALYIDTFAEAQAAMNNVLQLLTIEPGQSLIEDLINKLVENDWKKLSSGQEQQIKEKFNASQYHTMLIEIVMNYIGDNYKYLPMYAHPLITKLILYNLEESPLFKKPCI